MVDNLGRRVKVAALQEVCYKNEGVRLIGGGKVTYKLFWKGEEKGKDGVGIMVSDDMIKHVVVERINLRIMYMD